MFAVQIFTFQSNKNEIIDREKEKERERETNTNIRDKNLTNQMVW